MLFRSPEGTKLLKENKIINPHTIILGSPTNNNFIVEERGVFWVNVEVFGKTSHAGEPNKGINSIIKATKIINHLEKENTGKTYLVGEEFYKLKKESNSISFYKTKNELILEISNNKILEKNILIKGSRAMKMEELINLI